MPRATSHECLPGFISPMLLEAGAPAPITPGKWAVEVKFDGIRAQLRVDGDAGWTVRSRPGRDCTTEFPELAELAGALAAHRLVLDGELVHFAPDGRPDFNALRTRLTSRSSRATASAFTRCPATLVVFDLLHLDGSSTRELSYEERRELLADLIPAGRTWRLAPSWTERLEDVVTVTREHELEGVVFKRLDAPYRPGRRSPAWRKLKHRRQETLEVLAWRPGRDEPDTYFLGRRQGGAGESTFAGAVQFGLDGPRRERLRQLAAERELPDFKGRRVRPVGPGLALVVSGHGPTGRPLRDAVIREVVVAA